MAPYRRITSSANYYSANSLPKCLLSNLKIITYSLHKKTPTLVAIVVLPRLVEAHFTKQVSIIQPFNHNSK